MSVSNLLSTVWAALRGTIGGGQDFVVVYAALGAILWAFLLFKVFLQEGLQVASGQHSELPRILVKYLFIAGMFAIWPQASSSIFSAVSLLAATFYPNLDSRLDTMAGAMGFMEGSQQATANSQGLVSTVLGTLYNFTIGSLFVLIGMIVLFMCYALILINIAGSLTILAMNLVLGPVFFALSFDRDFRGHAHKCFAAVLSYFMLIPLYGAALTVAATIAGAAVPTNLFGLPSSAQILAQIIGPLMAVGVVFSTNKIVNALVGGASGSGLGSMALGVAGIGISLLPGGAVVRSTLAGGRMAVGAAASAGRAIGSKISSTARAELIARNAQGLAELSSLLITETKPLLKVQAYFSTKAISPVDELIEEGRFLAVLVIKAVKRSTRNPHGLILIEYRQSSFDKKPEG